MNKKDKEEFDLTPYLLKHDNMQHIKQFKLPSGFVVTIDMQYNWGIFLKEYYEAMKNCSFEAINYDYAEIASTMITNGMSLHFRKEEVWDNRSIDLVTEIGGKDIKIEVKTRASKPTVDQMNTFMLDCLSKKAELWVILIENSYLRKYGLLESQIQIVFFVLNLFRQKWKETHEFEDFDSRDNVLARALSEKICDGTSNILFSNTLHNVIENDKRFPELGTLNEFLKHLNLGIPWMNKQLITPLAMIKKLEQLYERKTRNGKDFMEQVRLREMQKTLKSDTTLLPHVFDSIENLELIEIVYVLGSLPEMEGFKATLCNFVEKITNFFHRYSDSIKKLDELGRILEVYDTLTKAGGEPKDMKETLAKYRDIIESIPEEYKLTMRVNLKVLLDEDEIKLLGIGNSKEKYSQRTWNLSTIDTKVFTSFMDDIKSVDCYDTKYQKTKNPYPKQCEVTNDLFENIKVDHRILENLKSEIITRTESELFELINQRHNVSSRGDEISSIRMDPLMVKTNKGSMKKWVITSPNPNSMTSGIIIEIFKRERAPKWWEQNAIHIGHNIWITTPRRQNYAQVSDGKSLQLGSKALRAFYVSKGQYKAADSFLPILFNTNYQRSLRAFADLSFFLYKCHNATLLTSNLSCEEKFGDINTCKLKTAFMIKNFCSNFKNFYAIYEDEKKRYKEKKWSELIDPLLGRKYESVDEFLMMIFLKSTFMPTSDGFDRLFLLSKACLSEAKYNVKWRNSPNKNMGISDNRSVKSFLENLFKDEEWQYYTAHMPSIDEAIKYHYKNRVNSTEIDIGVTVMTDKLNPTAMLNMTPGKRDERLINITSEKQSVSLPVLENEAKEKLRVLLQRWNINVDNISLTYLETACILNRKYPWKSVIHMDLKTDEKNYDKRDFYIVMADTLMLAREVEAYMLKVLRDDPFDVITLSGEYKILKIQETSNQNGIQTIVMMEDMDKFGQTYFMAALKRYLISLHKYHVISAKAASVGVNLIEKLEGRFMILPKEVSSVLRTFRSGRNLKTKHMEIIAGIEAEILETDYRYFEEFKLEENEGYTIERGFVLGLLNFLGSIGTLLSRVICKIWFEQMGIYDCFRALTHSDDIATWIKLLKPMRYRKPSQSLIKYIESGKKFQVMQNKLFFDDSKEVDMREMIVIISYLSLISTRIVGLRMSLNKFAVGPDEMLQYYNIDNKGHRIALSKMITSSVKVYGDSYKQDITKTSTGLWSAIVNGMPGYSFEFVNYVSQLGIRELYGFPIKGNLVRKPIALGGINFASYGKVIKNGFAEYYFRLLALSEESNRVDRLMRIMSTDRKIWKYTQAEGEGDSEGIMAYSKDWLITKHYKRDLPKTDEYISIQLSKLTSILWKLGNKTYQIEYSRQKIGECLTLLEEYDDRYSDFEDGKHNLPILEKYLKKINKMVNRIHKLGLISNIRFLSQLVAVVSKKVDKSSPGRIIRVCKGYRNRTIANDLSDDFKLNNNTIPGIHYEFLKIKEMHDLIDRIVKGEVMLPSRNLDMLKEIYKLELAFTRADYVKVVKPNEVKYIWTVVKIKEIYDNMPIELVSRFMLYQEQGSLKEESFTSSIGQKFPTLASYSSEVYLALNNLVSIFSKYGVTFNYFMDNIEIFEKFINIRRRNLIMRSPFEREFLDVTNGNYYEGGSNFKIANSQRNFQRNIVDSKRINCFALHMFFSIYAIEEDRDMNIELISNSRKIVNGREINLEDIKGQIKFDKMNYEKAQQISSAMILSDGLPYIRFRSFRAKRNDEVYVDFEIQYKLGHIVGFYKYKVSPDLRKKTIVKGSPKIYFKGFNSVREMLHIIEWWWIVNSIRHIPNFDNFKVRNKSGNVLIRDTDIGVEPKVDFGNTNIYMVDHEETEMPEWTEKDPKDFELIGEYEIYHGDELEFKVRNFRDQKDYFYLPWSFETNTSIVSIENKIYNPIETYKEIMRGFDIPMIIEKSVVKLTYLYLVLFSRQVVWEEVISAYFAALRIMDLIGGIDNSSWQYFSPTEEEVISIRNNGEMLVVALMCMKRGLSLRHLTNSDSLNPEDREQLIYLRNDISRMMKEETYSKRFGAITIKDIESYSFSSRGLSGNEIMNPKVLHYMISSIDNYEANILNCLQKLENFSGIKCGRIDERSKMLIVGLRIVMPKTFNIILDINKIDIEVIVIPKSPMRYYTDINLLENKGPTSDIAKLLPFFRSEELPAEDELEIGEARLRRNIIYLNPGENGYDSDSSDESVDDMDGSDDEEELERIEEENIIEFNEGELNMVGEIVDIHGEINGSEEDSDDDDMTLEEARTALGTQEEWGSLEAKEIEYSDILTDEIFNEKDIERIFSLIQEIEEEENMVFLIMTNKNNFWETVLTNVAINIMPIRKIRIFHEMAKKYDLRIMLEAVCDSDYVKNHEDYDDIYIERLINY